MVKNLDEIKLTSLEDLLDDVRKDLPEGATYEEIVQEAYVRVKVLQGVKAIEEGKIIPMEEAVKGFENILKNK